MKSYEKGKQHYRRNKITSEHQSVMSKGCQFPSSVSEHQSVMSKGCQLPSSVSEPQFLKYAYFQVHTIYLEDSNLYHPVTKHLKPFLSSTTQMDVNTGLLFKQLNPDTWPNGFKKGEQCGLDILRCPLAKSATYTEGKLSTHPPLKKLPFAAERDHRRAITVQNVEKN
ncbi:hypothetical protein STEG23_021869 [Scotinomys teguina]